MIKGRSITLKLGVTVMIAVVEQYKKSTGF